MGDAVCADKFGNSYNSGSAQGYWFTMDTVIEMNIGKFYINKYDAAGMRVWTATARGTTINSIMSSSRMKCDSLGNVYVCGTFSVDDSVYMAPNWYPVGVGMLQSMTLMGIIYGVHTFQEQERRMFLLLICHWLMVHFTYAVLWVPEHKPLVRLVLTLRQLRMV